MTIHAVHAMPAVIITGAAGGIGRALVREFSVNGYKTIAVDVAEEPADLNCNCYHRVDLGRSVVEPVYADSIFASILESLGTSTLSGLINNAAAQVLGGVDSLNLEGWQQTLNVNLLAPFFWTQRLLAPLEASRGCVLNISSIHATQTKSNFVAYATSKAALSGMTRAMAVDLGSRVRVNAIEPAAVDTDMLRAGFVGKPEQYEALKSFHPTGHIGQPADLAKLAVAIVRGDFGYLHGSCIQWDGGISSRLYDPD